MASITLYCSECGTSGSIRLTKSEVISDTGDTVVSGFEEDRSWHKSFAAGEHLLARIVFEKLFQHLDVESELPSTVIHRCDMGKKMLERLGTHLASESEIVPLILLGDAKPARIGELFRSSRGKSARVEFVDRRFVSQIRLVLGDQVVPDEVDFYLSLLDKFGFDTSELRCIGKKQKDQVPLEELGRQLKLFRDLVDGREPPHIAACLERNATGHGRLFVNKSQIEELERGDCKIDVSLADADELCDCYGAPRIIADWLVSEPKDSPVVLDAFSPADFRSLRDAEKQCTYLTPTCRLQNAGAAVVVCRLPGKKPNRDCSESNHHFHPGEEITIVLEGEVEFRLSSMGVVQRLAQFDFIHFEAEHPHVVINPSDRDAVFLSIRIMRPLQESTRRRFWTVLKTAAADLENLEENLRTPDIVALLRAFNDAYPSRESRESLAARVAQLRRVAEWLLKMRKPAHRSEQTPEEVRDFESLHRRVVAFLNYRRESDRQFDLRRIRWNEMLRAVRDGRERKITIADLEIICDQLSVPIVLLYDSLIAPVQTVVSICGSADWVYAPPRTNGNGTYQLPCRKLLGGDIEIVRLLLKANESCPLNDHPGSEMLLCVKGNAQIRFRRKTDAAEQVAVSQDVTLSPFQLCHFDSVIPHEVANAGETEAELLVIRFLDLRHLPFFDGLTHNL